MLSDQTRYRVTGTIFLVALAAIFFPMLFDGDGLEPLELPPLDEQRVDVSAVEAVQDVRVPDFASTIAGRDEVLAETDDEGYRLETGVKFGEPVLAEEDEPLEMPADAWAVQVGSFAAHERAVALRDRLRSDGYHVLVSQLKQADQRPQKLTRVAVGPMIDREDADRLKSELSDRYGVNAMVVKFGY